MTLRDFDGKDSDQEHLDLEIWTEWTRVRIIWPLRT